MLRFQRGQSRRQPNVRACPGHYQRTILATEVAQTAPLAGAKNPGLPKNAAPRAARHVKMEMTHTVMSISGARWVKSVEDTRHPRTTATLHWQPNSGTGLRHGLRQ